MQIGREINRGKTKTIYETDLKDKLVIEFRDDATAFNALKHQRLARKGMVNNYFNAFIMEKLAAKGILNHFESRLNDTQSLVKRLDMIKLECVVRNIAAGSLCKRLGIELGYNFETPLFEFFYKDDALGDPLVTVEHALAFGWANAQELATMRELTFAVNTVLKSLFADAGILLVDYKLEFGRFHGELFLGDEFTPDGCRIWDAKTRQIFDKDRFRQDLGDVIENYEIAAKRLGITYPAAAQTT
ncbi:MAG: phosphoribosylaminoimidazole-succinocarboxamide synthase [Gammaproteobacteria bacterium]|jgi:phosphoribosylaminoimidazole-succinocarboxamide synthase|nr:phosphoribosylaminoimidazole-succinocarboxamide synthase [Gammaproteobacteria bacterium]